MHLELPTIDFETFSTAGYVWDAVEKKWTSLPGAPSGKKGLKIVGSTAYAEHPSTDVLCLNFDMRDGTGDELWVPHWGTQPSRLLDYVDGGGIIESWNVAFEYYIWNKVCVPKYGWPPLKLRQLRCAMAKSRAFGYPGKLEIAGPAMHLTHQKDPEGKRLLTKFSVPRNPTASDPRARVLPIKRPELCLRKIEALETTGYKIKNPKKRKLLQQIKQDAEDTLKLYGYCRTDVQTEIEASAITPDLEGEELTFWQYDRAMNTRGIALDIAGVENCIAIVEQAHAQYNSELERITGGAVTKASELGKLADWILSRDVYVTSLDQEHLAELLAAQLPPDVRRALEIRQLVGSAAVKKVFAMRNSVTSDGRLHELFSYHAAHTGRVTGNGPQPTNMPNSGPKVRYCSDCGEYWYRAPQDEKIHTAHIDKKCPLCDGEGVEQEWSAEAAEFALGVISSRDLSYVEDYFADAMEVVSGCLRALFIASPGKNLICSDYSAIEAVVSAFLCGEKWRMEVFKTHGKIYEASAALITGTPFEEFMTHFGYSPEQLQQEKWWQQKPVNPGSHHPLRKKIGKYAELASGYGGWLGAWKKFGADEYLSDKEIKQSILAWRRESPSFVEMWGGQEREDEDGNKYAELFGLEGAAIAAIQNPGKVFGMKGIWYKLEGDALVCKLPSGRKLVYHEAVLKERKGKLAIYYMGYNSNPMKGKIGWVELETYGGSLFENVVQALARDILRYAIIQLERKGYKIVLQVYDELVAEISEGFGSLEEFEAIMSEMPEWAKDWPVKAKGGFIAKRYRK